MAADTVSGDWQKGQMDRHHDLFNRVESLVKGGDYRLAISLLEGVARVNHDATVEQRLIDLRIQAFPKLQWPETPDDWPPVYDRRFESVQGIPEIDSGDLEVGALKAGILGSGGLIVRGLMARDKVGIMREHIDRTLQARQSFAEGKTGTEIDPWYIRSPSVLGGPVQFGSLGGQQYTRNGSVWSVDSPTVAFELIEYYRSIGLTDLLRQYFGENAVLSVKKWVLRCVAPNNGSSSGWHQDGQFLGDSSIRTVNLWIALSDCGGDADAPGIEIVAGNDRKIYETGTHGAFFDWTVGQGLVDEVGKTNPIVCPRFQPGDAIFFDHYNLHRTAFGLNHTKNRYAVESWFFAGSTAPVKQQPLVL